MEQSPCGYASMQVCVMWVCEYVQPGEYVRLKGVDVNAYSYRPTGANPNIRKSDAIMWGLHCDYLGLQYSYLGLQYKYDKLQLRRKVPPLKVCKSCGDHQMLGKDEQLFKLFGWGKRGRGE